MPDLLQEILIQPSTAVLLRGLKMNMLNTNQFYSMSPPTAALDAMRERRTSTVPKAGAVTLADGSCLKYKFHYEKGNQFRWFRTYEHELLKFRGSKDLMRQQRIVDWISAVKPPAIGPDRSKYFGKKSRVESKLDSLRMSIQKQKLPTLGLWNSGTDHAVIAADIDSDISFQTNQYLRERYDPSNPRSPGAVASSYSGNPKIFFPVKVLGGGELTVEVAKAYLQEVLPGEIYELCDLTLKGMSETFITEEVYEVLSEIRNKAVAYIDAFTDDDYATIPCESISYTPLKEWANKEFGFLFCKHPQEESKSNHKFLISEEDPQEWLPELQFWMKNNSERKKFLKILLKMKGLLWENGFNLSTHKLGDEIGVSAPSANKYIKYLEKVGYLECIDESFQIGVKAKTYIATGKLREAIEKLNTGSESRSVRKELPSHIPDGQWECKLWEAHWAFELDADAFQEWAYSLNGSQEEYRPRKIVRIAEWMTYLRSNPGAKTRPPGEQRLAA